MDACRDMEHHDYDKYARNFAERQITGTDYLSYRDLPELLRQAGCHGRALDFGCGTGRSTRFIKSLGFDVVGADISEAMIAEARKIDPDMAFHHIDGKRLPFADESFDLVFSSYVVLEIETMATLRHYLSEAKRVLRTGGTCVILTTTTTFYQGSWISCDVDFPENRPPLRSGQLVKVRLLPQNIELLDTFWSDIDNKEAFAQVGFKLEIEHRPLGRPDEPHPWKDETHSPPYVLYVLKAAE